MPNAIHEVFAYLSVSDTQEAIDFYVKAFGAVELYRLTEPSGRIGHAELQMGPSAVLMLSDPYPEYGITPPPPEGLSGMRIHLHVDNADDMARAAVAAGCSTRSATPGCWGIPSKNSRPRKCSAATPS
jgi:PhnB protein